MQTVDVHIHGSGAVALAAALALGRLGLSVGLSAPPSRSTESREDVRAYAQHQDIRAYALNARSVALLQSLKVWDALAPDAKTAVYDMHIEGDAAGAALDFSAWQQRVDQLAWIVDAAALETALRDAIRFAAHVRQLDGEGAAAALQIVAEGHDSATRERLGVAMPLHLHGQRALAARLVASRPHAGLARQWFRCPDVLALLPFDRPSPSCSYGLVWSLPEARALELMAMSEAAFNLALMDATGGAAGELSLASARADWPLASGRAEAVCGPGWALLGDAAHRVHPLAGQGLNLGLADVAVLAEVVAAREPWRALGDERLLRRYARARELPTRAMLHVTDGLLELFASPTPWLRELRNHGLNLVNRLGPLKRALTARALDA